MSRFSLSRRAILAAGAALPRLQRGQPDHKLIRAGRAKVAGVPFDHRAHEPRVSFCASCHHQTLAACATCHTVTGSPRGGG
ncbi:MAG: cytochrome c family protein, partial [Alphaproteobacteria bacterium]|nr:cytochrome c family protein [Alphaproteobacteria bacterium]